MTRSGLEPWPSYASQDEDERQRRFQVKVSEARLQGELLYAKALCVAVASTEALAGDDGSPDLEDAARKAAQSIDQHLEDLLKPTKGWTPK